MELCSIHAIFLTQWSKTGGSAFSNFFSIYIYSSLQKLKDSGCGCHVGRTFAGAFFYLDDLALVSSSLSGLRQMIKICEQYAMEYYIVYVPRQHQPLTNSPNSMISFGSLFMSLMMRVYDRT